MVGEVRVVEGISYTLTYKKVKNLNLRVRPDGTVAVSASRWCAKKTVDEFVRDRADWIRRQQRRAAQRQGEPIPATPEKGAALPILQAALDRVWPLVEPLGVPKPVLKARKMTSRWGSCHYGKGVVVLNTALAALPDGLRDYVALHELCHFLHPNHGAGFYSLLAGLMPDWQTRRKALRGYEGMLRT